jgi:hypothetical protein
LVDVEGRGRATEEYVSYLKDGARAIGASEWTVAVGASEWTVAVDRVSGRMRE